MKKIIYSVLSLPLLLLLTSCAAKIQYTEMNALIKQKNCPEAMQLIESSSEKYGKNSKLLYHLDHGMALSMCGEYENSNEHLHKAEEIHNELYTKSIAAEGLSLLLNDTSRPYEGEDYEKTMINLFSAINYAALNKFDEALVEIRRLDVLLSELNSKYEDKSMYKEDAFARHISGLLYENTKKYDDAFIDLNKAFDQYDYYAENYNTAKPQYLYKDLVRLAKITKRTDEIADKIKNEKIEIVTPKDSGKVVILHMSGVAPVKVSDKIIIPTPAGVTAISFPRFIRQSPSCNDYAYNIAGNPSDITVHGELVENISAIAIKNLEDRKVRHIARVAVKAVAKTFVKDKVADEVADRIPFGFLIKPLLDLFDVSTDSADIRSWRTLPDSIYLATADLKEGEYNMTYGGCGLSQSKNITIEKDKTQFVIFQSF